MIFEIIQFWTFFDFRTRFFNVMYQLCGQRSRDDTKFQRIWIQFTASVLWRKSSVIRSNRSSSKIYFTLLYVHPDSLLRLRLFREAFYRSWKRQFCKCSIGEQKANFWMNNWIAAQIFSPTQNHEIVQDERIPLWFQGWLSSTFVLNIIKI